MTLNRALEQMVFCPRCGRPDPELDLPRSLHCPACAYRVHFNPKLVGCAIARTERGEVILIRRGFDPGQGRWSMPGGFVDLGETVEDAVRRELREELSLELALGPVVGVYSEAATPNVVVVYAADALGVPAASAEAPQVRAFAPSAIPWHHLAFSSDALALRDALA